MLFLASGSTAVPLINPVLSSTYIKYNCKPDKCTAEKAIDGDIETWAMSDRGGSWAVEFAKTVLIDKVLLTLGKTYYEYYSAFKLETKTSEEDAWSVCKGPYKVELPMDPHEVKCDAPTTAKFLRISPGPGGTGRLTLVEVTVETGEWTHPKIFSSHLI